MTSWGWMAVCAAVFGVALLPAAAAPGSGRERQREPVAARRGCPPRIPSAPPAPVQPAPPPAGTSVYPSPSWTGPALRSYTAPALPAHPSPTGVSIYPSPSWTGPALRSYTAPTLPTARPPAPCPPRPRPHVVLVPVPVSPEVVLLPGSDSAAPAGGPAVTVAGIEAAWLAGRPAALAAYLPDVGGIVMADGGRNARAVSAAEFLGAVGLAMGRATTYSLRLATLEAVAGGMVRASGQRVSRDTAGRTTEGAVYYLLQQQGPRWVIVAADIGPA